MNSVSVCEIRPWKRHFAPPSPMAIFGVSFYVCPTVRSQIRFTAGAAGLLTSRPHLTPTLAQ